MGLSHAPRVITDGLTLALDAAPNPRFSNYKGRSVAFDGTGDRLSITSSTDFDIGSAKTWECWFKLDTVSTGELLMGSLSNHWLNIGFSGIGGLANKVGFSILDGSWNAINSTTSIVAGSWYHVAVTWDGTYAKLYLNGVLEVTSADWSAKTWASNNGNPYEISGYSGNDASSIDGSISNLRITDSVLYTSNFTPPTEPLTAVTNTKLLTCQGNTISDASSSAHTITPTGNVVIDYNGPFSGSGWTDLTNRGNSGTLTNGPVFTQEPKLEPFGGAGAVQFDGDNDYLTIPDSADWDFGTGDFTVEYWYNSSTTSGITEMMVETRAATYTGWGASFTTSGAAEFTVRNGSSAVMKVTDPSTSNDGNWHHFAATRSGTSLKLFIDGTQVDSDTNSYNISAVSPLYIGSNNNQLLDFNGKISNLRVIKGTALYTSNFTPPRKKLEVTSDTVLLTCEKGTIRDRSPSAHAITINGGAHLITGASYFKFDGSNDYISINQFDHTATNTVEMWFKKTADVLYACPYAWGFLPTQRWQFTSGDENMSIYYNTNNGGTQVYEDSGINVTTLEGWVHIVVTADYNNDEYKTYKNGSLVQTGDLNNQDWSYVGSQSYNFIDICRNVNNNNGFMSGNVSVLRIYRKVLTAAEVEQNFNALRGRYGI